MQRGNTEPPYTKLLPIYDALDGRNYKQGLRLIQQCSPKFPHSQILKALQCLALHRTERRSEALALLKEVLAGTPYEDTVLSPLAMVLKSEEDWQGLAEMFIKASAALPGHQELAEQAFYAAVRAGSGKEMQRLAQGLYKRSPDVRYTLWQVGSIYTQALQDGVEGTGSLQVTLASKMLERLFKDGKALEQEVALLYIDLLSAQGQYGQAIEFCCCKSASQAFRRIPERLAVLQSLYVSAQKWPEALAVALRQFQELDRDGWSHYLAYLDALEHVIQDGSLTSPASVTLSIDDDATPYPLDITFQEAVKRLQDLKAQEEQAQGKRNRAPFLGIMELCKRALAWHNVPALAANLLPHEQLEVEMRSTLLAYVSLFGTKPVCPVDAMSYIADWAQRTSDPAAAATALLADIEAQLVTHTNGDDAEATLRKLQGRMTVLKLQQCCGLLDSLSLAEVETLAMQYMEEYHTALPLNKSLEKMEKGYGDDLAVLAALLLVYHAHTQNHPPFLTQALWCLEYAASQGRYNSYIMVLKALVYGQLGVCASDLLQVMDVKYIQLDTLTYLCLPAGRRVGHWSRVRPLSQAVVQFHRACRTSGPDDVAHVFQYGSYSKLKEFHRFTARLQHSIVALECGVETLLGHIQEMRHSDQALEFLRANRKQWGALQEACQSGVLRSNEDLDVLDIVIPRLRGSPGHQVLREALLPVELLPSPEAALPGRIKQCRLLLCTAVVLQSMLLIKTKGDNKAAKKATKGKKGNPEPKADAVSDVVDAEADWPSPLDSLGHLEGAWAECRNVDLPKVWPLLVVTLKACALLLHEAQNQFDQPSGTLTEALQECHAAAAEACPSDNAIDGFNDLGIYLQPLSLMLQAVALTLRASPFAGPLAALKSPFRAYLQAVLPVAEHLHKAVKGSLGTSKDQFWNRLRPSVTPQQPAPQFLQSAAAKTSSVAAESFHQLLVSAEDTLKNHVMDLQAALRTLA